MRLYYAQNKEDLFIKGFFPDVERGFYIDVGANDPVVDSVTKLLYDEGWSGINIEPIPRHFKALETQRSRDINLNIGLSHEPGELSFNEYSEGDGLSTFDPTMVDFYTHHTHPFPTVKRKEYKVVVKTIKGVLREHAVAHVHFIKIDVEGYEYQVIMGHDWQDIRPELICIEANHIHKDWRPVLASHRYHEVFFDGVNSYYLAEESLHRKEYFNYPDIVFAGNPVYYPAFIEIEKDVKTSLEPQMQALSAKISDQEQQIALLHRQQRDVRYLGKRFFEELQIRLNKRAKGGANHMSLVYRHDTILKNVLVDPPENTAELLRIIHTRDRLNIGEQQRTLGDRFKPLFWRGVAKLCAITVRYMKKIAGRMMYGRTR